VVIEAEGLQQGLSINKSIGKIPSRDAWYGQGSTGCYFRKAGDGSGGKRSHEKTLTFPMNKKPTIETSQCVGVTPAHCFATGLERGTAKPCVQATYPLARLLRAESQISEEAGIGHLKNVATPQVEVLGSIFTAFKVRPGQGGGRKGKKKPPSPSEWEGKDVSWYN